MAASVESRKRFAGPFVNVDHFRDLAKRGRYDTPCAVEHPLHALRDIFPCASPHDLDACFAASGGNIHAAHALVLRLARGECAGVLVEQMAAATDTSDATNRASWVVGLIKSAAAEEAARLREENALLREQSARLREEAAALRERAAAAEQDNAVLKHGGTERVHVNKSWL